MDDLHSRLVESTFRGIARHRDGVITEANDAFARIFGRRADELKGLPLVDFIPSEMDSKDRSGDQQAYETIGIGREGEAISLEVVTVSLPEPGELATAIRDVTPRRRFEKSIRQAQKLEAIGHLAAGVAHEINNPLTYVLLNLDTMRGELEASIADPGARKEMAARLDELIEGAERVQKLVKDLKTFARAEEEETFVPVSLAQVIEKAVKMAGSEIRFRARLATEFADMPTVRASESRLIQVFLNLLMNAAQAIEEGAADRNVIGIRVHSEESAAVVEVSDTGRGISKQHLEKIFDPFFTTKDAETGTGLGLAICRSIVLSHEGAISVVSVPGRGTKFLVTLPLAEASAPAAAAVVPLKSAEKTRRIRMLVVDDESEIRAAIARVCAGAHDVVEACHGRAALEILEKDRAFDLILCDLMMPEFTGMDLHGEISRRFPDLLARLVFMSGGDYTPKTRAFLESVENRCLPKPFRAKVIRELIAGVGAEMDQNKASTAP